ncbi:MAG: KTSC domain-containing protein [Rhizomicrobium sp.]
MPSTVIKSHAYDPARHELAIVFQTGRRYTYFDVPPDTGEGMKQAFSKGEYFNAHIRDRFRFERTDR